MGNLRYDKFIYIFLNEILILTKNVFVEGPCEVDVEQLFVVDCQTHHPPGKSEVAEVIWVDVGQTVRLKCST